MSRQSRIPYSFMFVAGLLSVAVVIFFLRPSGESAGEEGEVLSLEKRNHSSTGHTVMSANQDTKYRTHRREEETDVTASLRTKASDRPSAEETEENKKRTEFWRGAKLPDDLMAASLPVLQAAERPPSSTSLTSPSNADLSAAVPGAFQGQQEEFDYKRANELLYLWLTTEPEAASAWLSGQPDFSNYDMAFGMIADSMAHAGYPDIGNQWVDLIPSPDKREDARTGMYAGMVSRGENIPPEITAEVANSDRID